MKTQIRVLSPSPSFLALFLVFLGALLMPAMAGAQQANEDDGQFETVSASRPFASQSYCYASDLAGVDEGLVVAANKSRFIVLLEKNTENQWVYSLMSSWDQRFTALDLFDGGNACSQKITGSERRFDCENFNTEKATRLVLGLNFDRLKFFNTQDVVLKKPQEEADELILPKGESVFKRIDLESCAELL